MNNIDDSVQPTISVQTPSIQTVQGNISTNNLKVNPKTNFPIITGFFMIILFVGMGVYLLGTRKSQTVIQNIPQQILPTPSAYSSPTRTTNSPTSMPSTQQTSPLPIGWSYKSNNECEVKFAIPPKEVPYYQPIDPNRLPSVTNDEGSGRYWDFPRGGVYPNMLTKFPNGYELQKQASAMYASIEEASGYVASAVAVSCIPNTESLNGQSMLNVLKTKLEKYNQDQNEAGMQPTKYTIQTSSIVDRWNHKVYDLTVLEYYQNSGGQPYTNSTSYSLFATPKYIYEVRVLGETNNAFVKETAIKIFDNLFFE